MMIGNILRTPRVKLPKSFLAINLSERHALEWGKDETDETAQ